MQIETLSEIIEELADKLYIYGDCRSQSEEVIAEKCNNDSVGIYCCRKIFESEMEERILEAIKNEKAINTAFLNIENELGDSGVTGEHGELHDVALSHTHGSETKTPVERPLPSITQTESSFYCGKYFSNGDCKEQCVGCAEAEHNERKVDNER